MKNIVVTIQREQNAVLRNETAQVLIPQGVAGSGKTSIALHRVAFLLHRFILSPNKVFGDDIADVVFARLDRVGGRAPRLLKQQVVDRGVKWSAADTVAVRKQVRAMFPFKDALALYRAFYESAPGPSGPVPAPRAEVDRVRRRLPADLRHDQDRPARGLRAYPAPRRRRDAGLHRRAR
jgi:DNA helicase-2/ATP-dependent DNA helicase PcrA